MKVKDYSIFRCFDYRSAEVKSTYELGDVVVRYPTKYYGGDEPEIGVVIQIHDDGEFRTDMFGNTSDGEVKLATMEEIEKYRPGIIKDLD